MAFLENMHMTIFMASMMNCIEEVQENLLKQNEKKMVIYYEKRDGNSKRITKCILCSFYMW